MVYAGQKELNMKFLIIWYFQGGGKKKQNQKEEPVLKNTRHKA